jgi:hypothetical protein
MPRRPPSPSEQPCGSVCRHVRGPLPQIGLDAPAWLRAGLNRLAAAGHRSAPGADVRAAVACPVRERLMARAYLRGPVSTRAAVPAYRAFRTETARQFDLLTRSPRRGGLGVEVTTSDLDPYRGADEMMLDLVTARKLTVFRTSAAGNPHPWLSDDDNDMFRAVHDIFGHAAAGRGFDRHGEEAAWLEHCRLYSPAARRALTTETRGQSSVLFAAYAGERFPRQKLFLLPLLHSDPRWSSVGRRAFDAAPAGDGIELARPARPGGPGRG